MTCRSPRFANVSRPLAENYICQSLGLKDFSVSQRRLRNGSFVTNETSSLQCLDPPCQLPPGVFECFLEGQKLQLGAARLGEKAFSKPLEAEVPFGASCRLQCPRFEMPSPPSELSCAYVERALNAKPFSQNSIPNENLVFIAQKFINDVYTLYRIRIISVMYVMYILYVTTYIIYIYIIA